MGPKIPTDLVGYRRGRRCANTARPLTHSLDYTEEGLAMEATRTTLRLSARFHYRWARMLTPGHPDECWEWAGRLDDKGYGFVKIYGRTTRVHRTAWAIAHGHWPAPGMVVRHTCDNPPCCNPAHLVLGTVRDNVQDCIERGRRARGESLRQSKLTAEDVRAIRARAAAGVPQPVIAADFGICPSNVSSIVRRRTWKEVAG